MTAIDAQDPDNWSTHTIFTSYNSTKTTTLDVLQKDVLGHYNYVVILEYNSVDNDQFTACTTTDYVHSVATNQCLEIEFEYNCHSQYPTTNIEKIQSNAICKIYNQTVNHFQLKSIAEFSRLITQLSSTTNKVESLIQVHLYDKTIMLYTNLPTNI